MGLEGDTEWNGLVVWKGNGEVGVAMETGRGIWLAVGVGGGLGGLD